VAGVAVYKGAFGAAQAERLLWRAGFGPRRGEAEALAKLGLDGAVHALTHPGNEHLVGHDPHDDKGHPLAPYDAWGQDHVWWLDRMVRTSRPLVERMTLVWHDWFATSNSGVGSQKLMLQQNQLLRARGLGSFHDLLVDVTKDPAMLLWLNGSSNSKGSPNENYAREMMELFTLGADRGYTELDVRQQARALTGFRNDWTAVHTRGRTPAASASRIPTTRRSSSGSCGATSPRPGRTGRRRRGSSGCTSRRSTWSGRSWRPFCVTRRSTRGRA
jgi:hypothetical protein